MQQRGVNPDPLGDVAQRHAVESMFRKQILRGVQDLFQTFGALLRFTAPLALRSFRHLPSPH